MVETDQYSSLIGCLSVWLIHIVLEFQKPQEEERNTAIFDVKKILGLLTLPGVGTLMLVKTVCGIPLGIFQVISLLIG